jgi:hypothetical protein
VDDRNRGAHGALSTSQLDTIAEVAGDVAERCGYTW